MYAHNWDGSIAKSVTLSRRKLTLIAGPCMLESLELGLKVGHFLAETCARHHINYIFKASYDKANRTSKSSARGPGLELGLEWLSTIGAHFNVPVLTDVHTPAQAIEAAKFVDVLQIPAFLCQQRELLAAAASTQKCIQIKKGQHVAPEQMLDAAAYINSLGNNRVILCERGSAFGYNNLVVDFRNLIEMHREGSPVVFDATHAAQLPGAGKGKTAGLRHVIPGLARAALALGVDGLFMEVHENPDKALSDASTQLDFATAKQVIEWASKLYSPC